MWDDISVWFWFSLSRRLVTVMSTFSYNRHPFLGPLWVKGLLTICTSCHLINALELAEVLVYLNINHTHVHAHPPTHTFSQFVLCFQFYVFLLFILLFVLLTSCFRKWSQGSFMLCTFIVLFFLCLSLCCCV